MENTNPMEQGTGQENPMNNKVNPTQGQGTANPMNGEARKVNPMQSSPMNPMAQRANPMEQGTGQRQSAVNPFSSGKEQGTPNPMAGGAVNNPMMQRQGTPMAQSNVPPAFAAVNPIQQAAFSNANNPMEQRVQQMQEQAMIPPTTKHKRKKKKIGCLVPILVVVVAVAGFLFYAKTRVVEGSADIKQITGDKVISINAENCKKWIMGYAGAEECESDDTFDEYYIPNYSNCMIDVFVSYKATTNTAALVEYWKGLNTGYTEMYEEVTQPEDTAYKNTMGDKVSSVIDGSNGYVEYKITGNCYTYGFIAADEGKALFVTAVSSEEMSSEAVKGIFEELLKTYN